MIFIETLFSNASSYILGKAIDAATLSNFTLVAYLFIGYIICIQLIPNTMARLRYVYEVKKTGYDLGHHVQKESLFKSLDLSLGQLRREHSGFKQDVLHSGENAINYFYDLITDQIFPIITSLIVAFVGLYFIDVKFFLISVVFAVFYLIYRSYMNKKIRKSQVTIRKMRADKNRSYVDMLRSLFFIKFSNQKATATKHLSKAQDELRDFGVDVWSKFHYQALISDTMFILYYSVCVYFIYNGLVSDTLTIGSVFPIFAWMNLIGNSIEQIQNVQQRSVVALSDLEKMFEMLDQESDVPVLSDARSIKDFETKISFENVSYDYNGGKKGALKTINFDIKKGEKVALVGRSGSGKTTIISLLLRLYDPTKGAVMVDKVDLKALELSDWHNMIAYVPQDGDLLDISIRDNILFGAKHIVTEAEIDSVLEKAGIKEFIKTLPHGIESTVGEKGVKLSGGQKQRVCIARALIKDAPILLLDEATSSLDSETESLVNKAIWDMLGDKTGVVIAHRLSTVIDADKIIVMDHGEIVGIGTHKELLKSLPYYKKLVDAQNVNL